jgi:hypothetical protein
MAGSIAQLKEYYSHFLCSSGRSFSLCANAQLDAAMTPDMSRHRLKSLAKFTGVN